MKKLNIVLVILLCFVTICLQAQKEQKSYTVYAVGFYNLENLFDTCHDEGKNDYEYLPTGANKWTGMKYSHKLRNMSRVLSEMGTDVLANVGCSFIGVSEVENAKALTDLCNQEPLKARNFQFAHIEGPDRRGVDCALLYNPALFQVDSMYLVPYVPEEEKDSTFKTRGYFTVCGRLAGEPVSVVVCHWPSRFSTSYYREVAGRQTKAVVDDLRRKNPEMKVFVMGDLNDDPINTSVTQGLRGKANVDEVGDDDMYNPWYNVLAKEGRGTLSYQGSWNLFDQILLSSNLINKNKERNYESLKYWKNQIFRRDYLFQQDGQYKGSPKRTHAGGVWLDGYSDHLPTVVYLVKEKK